MTAESLKFRTKEQLPDGSTLVQLGSGNIFHATWEQVNHRKWTFVLIRPELGSLGTLRDYVSSLDPSTESDAYVIVESQGDARRIKDVSILNSQTGQQLLEVYVQDKIPPTDPNKCGSTIKIGHDDDLYSPDGNLVLVRGLEAAQQHIMCSMGVIKGEIKGSEEVGSLASEYYAKYGGNLELLSRLMKMEFIRLSLIPVSRRYGGHDQPKPPLHFVKRFNECSDFQ